MPTMPVVSYEGPIQIRMDVFVHVVPPGEATPAKAAEATPEQMLDRLQRNGGNAANQQTVWDGLKSLGLVPGLTEARTGTRTGNPQPWVNWRKGPSGPASVQPGWTPVICEVNSMSVWFTRAADVPKVKDLPGAHYHEKNQTVRFSIMTQQEVAQALDAVEACL